MTALLEALIGYDRRAEQSFADFISNVKDVKTVNLCAENNN